MASPFNVSMPSSPISALAPTPQVAVKTSAKSSSYVAMSSMKYGTKSAGVVFVITLVIVFLVALLVLFLWKPERIQNEDGSLNTGKLVGASIVFALLVAGIVALTCC